jgi:predicted Zn-dependent protease
MNADIIERPASGSDAEAGALRALLSEGRYEQALVQAKSVLAGAPEDREALYAAAVAERHLNRVAEALATLGRLEELHPKFSRLYQERGQCYILKRSAANAIDAFEQAVGRCGALPASWMALERLYRMSGRLKDAETASSHVAKLASLPREVVSASALFADGDTYAAERMIRDFLRSCPDDVEGMRLLARIGIELDVLDDAEFLLESALMLEPDYHAARYDYAVVLLKRHKHVRARQELDRLLARDPASRVYRTTDAAVCMGLGDFEGALARYRALQARTPRDPDLHLSVAHALKTLGNTAEAIDSYRAAAAVKPSYGEAYWSLANLKTYRFTEAELDRMQSEEAKRGVSRVDRYHLCFALGKALEDACDYTASFAHYQRGNALKLAECRYRPEVIELNAHEQRRVCTADFFARRRSAGAALDPAPIFVVGLPRSGSTLIEQILSSHSQVEGTMELGEIPRLVQDLQGRRSDEEHPRYPAVLPELPIEEFRRFGEQYLLDTRCYRRSGRPRFIDKNPNNFRHIGLIHLMLPNAKIIDARRHPMACCFGNFKQLFAVGQQFTYSLEHIARYYRSYVDLMRHWDTVLPGKILRVHHEDVVNGLEGSVRRILEFCDLDFEPACLDFHRTRRQVNTASSEQVRRPLYRDGMDQWRHFEPHLDDLRRALGPIDERPER